MPDPLTPYGNKPMVTPNMPPERRTTFGVKKNTVRLTVEIEQVE